MDSLTAQERVFAWEALWPVCPIGIAIVNDDFTFRSVNPAFCELLNITPAEVIGLRFQDITPLEIAKIDEKNAKLVMEGKMDGYTLPKTYDFGGGHTARVNLTVSRAPSSEKGQFLFFVSQIVLDEPILNPIMELPTIPRPSPRPDIWKAIGDGFRWGIDNYKVTVSVVIGICTGIYYLLEKIPQLAK